MIQKRKVTDEGQISDLKDFAGREVIVVKTPNGVSGERTEKVAKAFEKPLAAIEDVRRFVVEHRDLTRRQVDEFTARYGNPADKARTYAKNLKPEEFRAKVNEINALVEKRLETISEDVERRYADLEKEVETAIERVFGRKVKEATEPADAPRDVEVEPVNGDAPKATATATANADAKNE